MFVLYRADSLAAHGACGDVFVSVLRQPMTVESLGDIRRHAARHAAEFGRGRTRSLTVIEPQGMRLLVPEGVRRESEALTKEFPVLAAAIAIEGQGFEVAAMRSFVAGIYLLQRSPSPRKIFGGVVDAAKWLASAVPGTASPAHADFVHAVEDARRAIRG